MNTSFEMTSDDLLDAALLAVENKIGISFDFTDDDEAIFIEDLPHLRYTPEIRPMARYELMGVLANHVLRKKDKGVLVTDYVNPGMAEQLRRLDVPFIDSAGNAYINEKGLRVFWKDAAPSSAQQQLVPFKPPRQSVAFNPTGLKVVYVYLRDPYLINSPYRDIAVQADVALDTVGRVVSDLKRLGFIYEPDNRNRWLTGRKQLLDEWVKGYLEILRPRQFLGSFSLKDDFLKMLTVGMCDFYGIRLSGETAYAMTHDHEPSTIDIYLPENNQWKLLSDYGLYSQKGGRVNLYKAFWQNVYEKGNKTYSVNPIIMYADLLARADSESLRLARIVYDEQLQAHVR